MDGFKARLNGSLQWRLSLVLAAVMVLAAIAAGTFSYLAAFESANELQDDTLREIAALALRQPPGTSFARPPGAPESLNQDARVIVEIIGTLAPGSGARLPLPAHVPDGLGTRDIAGVGYRILVQTLADGRRIAIAQQTDLRDDAAQDSALRTVLPMMMLTVVLLVAVALVVRKLIAPITAAAHELDARDQHDMRPLNAQSVPAEVRPFIVALNRMLGRLTATLAAERRFVADAAHELRTPMTAISLQAERLAEAPMSAEATTRLATLRQGIARGTELLDQLLSLARARRHPSQERCRTSTRPVVRRVLADLLPMAQAKDIDIGIADDADALVALSEADLYMLIRNLADNAVRYSPTGGRVDLAVSLREQQVLVAIIDQGPGVPPDELERVFAPFYRGAGQEVPGTGLGLAIVASIVDKAGGAMALHNYVAEEVRGLRAEVTLARLE